MIQPKSVLHRLDAPALDQGRLSACTGFAAAQWLNCGKAKNSRAKYNYTSRGRRDSRYVTNNGGIALYMTATQDDDFDWTYPPIDNGSSSLGVAKALRGFGAIDRYDWTFSFAGFLAALQAQPVLLGTVWTDSMFDPDADGIIRATTSLDIDSGHEYLARGINWPRQLIRIRNNWTPEWGINGDAYIPFVDMEKLLDAQGDSLVPVLL
jgi:hypothetical protein